MPTDTVIHDNANNTGTFINPNDRYTRNYKALDRQYGPWQAVYQEIADYIAIGRGRFISKGELANQKTKAAAKVINNTATDALHMLGAGLHGGLSSPARPWFQLQFVDPGMNDFKVYREWLDDCEKVMYAAFKRSNFYTIVHGAYEEVGGFGTGSMMVDETSDGVLFYPFTAGDYRFTVRADQLCHNFYRKYRMQACQVEQEFGIEKCSDKVVALLRTNPYEWVDIIHVLEPNIEHNAEKMDSKAVTSIYFEAKENERRLYQGGYHEMPVVVPRWQALSNEAYGWGPGLDSLGFAKAIQRKEKMRFLAEDKALDPPMGVPPSMKDRMLDLSPSAKNVYDPNEGAITPLIQVDLQALVYYDNSITAVEEKIRRMFFNELFLMIANADTTMTATEVMARQEEKMLMIGPTIERLEYEFLDPIVERVFNILMRQGKLPQPPQELSDAEYRIEYVSVLAQAQKLINSQAMQGYLAIAERVVAVDPGSAIKTDWDQFLEEMGNTVSLPAKIIRSDDDTQEIRDAEAAKQEEMEELAKGEAETDQMKTLSETQTQGGGNALSDLQDAVGG